jgi:hypothetical protein
MTLPEFKDKFRDGPVRAVIADVLARLKTQNYTGDVTLAKQTADEIRDRLKDLNLPKYKLFVHVVIGESRGQGVQISNRCFWDDETDAFVSESVRNDTLYAVATAYGLYHY